MNYPRRCAKINLPRHKRRTTMSKPKVYGSFRSFLPNSRADSRRRKVWEHNRRVAERDPRNGLPGAVRLWPTPSASDGGRTAINPIMTSNGTIRHKNKAGGQSYARLDAVAALFPTPTARCGQTPCEHGEGGRTWRPTYSYSRPLSHPMGRTVAARMLGKTASASCRQRSVAS